MRIYFHHSWQIQNVGKDEAIQSNSTVMHLVHGDVDNVTRIWMASFQSKIPCTYLFVNFIQSQK
jgi:hypothetical protein